MPGKSINAPVGAGGANFYPDVMTVQYLLNCVPVSDGGPSPELVIDGVAGPLTVGAVRAFQKVQFGWNDGRVDPEAAGGVTIVELNEYDPAPNSPPFTFGSIPVPGGRAPGFPRPRGKARFRTKKHSGVPRTKKHSGVRNVLK